MPTLRSYKHVGLQCHSCTLDTQIPSRFGKQSNWSWNDSYRYVGTVGSMNRALIRWGCNRMVRGRRRRLRVWSIGIVLSPIQTSSSRFLSGCLARLMCTWPSSTRTGLGTRPPMDTMINQSTSSRMAMWIKFWLRDIGVHNEWHTREEADFIG